MGLAMWVVLECGRTTIKSQSIFRYLYPNIPLVQHSIGIKLPEKKIPPNGETKAGTFGAEALVIVPSKRIIVNFRGSSGFRSPGSIWGVYLFGEFS